MERFTFTDLVSRLSAEHERLLQDNERLLRECEELRSRERGDTFVAGGAGVADAAGDASPMISSVRAAKVAAEDSATEGSNHAAGVQSGAPGTYRSQQQFETHYRSHGFLEDNSEPPKEECRISCLDRDSSTSERKAVVIVETLGEAPSVAPMESQPASEVGHMHRGSLSITMSRASAPQLKLWPLWTAGELDEGDCELIKRLITNNTAASNSLVHMGPIGSRHTSTVWSPSCAQRLVMRPNSTARISWDMLSVLVLGYDILSVPMLAFTEGTEQEPSWKQMLDFATTVFWTCDIVASFLSGFHNGGVVEMRPSRIRSRYMRGWFVLDLPVVLLDWVITFQQMTKLREVVGIGRITKVLRVSRVLRLFRLVRMLKLPGWALGVGDYLFSEGIVTSLGVLRSLVVIAIANHFIACAWYFVGGWERPFTWVQVLDDEGREVPYRYATALHWSVTQFTPASMEIVPRNTVERVFTVLVILLAMVAFSCFVSSITQAMASLQRSHMERDKQQNNMRQYIAENHISLELGHRITRFMRAHDVMAKGRVKEKDVQIFKLLPESLRRELHWEVHFPTLGRHPLLKQSLFLDNTFMLEVCHTAMTENSLGRSEELFHPGQEASTMYFTRSGVWEYRRKKESARPYATSTQAAHTPSASVNAGPREEEFYIQELKGEEFVCEVALWLQWELQGYLVAATRCECASLNAGRFRKIANRTPCIYIAFREYANRYLQHRLQGHGGDISEIGFPMETLEEVVREALEMADELCVSESFSRSLSITRQTSRASRSKWRLRFWCSESPSLRSPGDRYPGVTYGSEQAHAADLPRRGRARWHSV